ncbi:MAG: hypothetical protein ACRED9_01590 [Caulobacteraceae bacterium]
MVPSRRGVLKGVGLAGLACGTPTGAAELACRTSNGAADPEAEGLQATLERYFSFGDKASGGPGDQACAAWLEGELSQAGYACRRQSFEVPYFEVRQATLRCGDARATVLPQAIVAETGPQGLSAPLRLANGCADLAGAIALVILPYQRWISLSEAQAARPLAEAIQRGAVGVVLVTTGPSREAIALNVSTHVPAVGKPVAILAPEDAPPFVAAASEGPTATLTLDGSGGRGSRRLASNLIATLDRGAAKTVVIFTPRSGWFGCAAERGSGLAIWLSLAKWLARTSHAVNVEVAASSGHEYDFLGGERFLAEAAPPPASTKLWVHIGASAGARDWHVLGPKLLPLPSADAQRFMTATPDLLERTKCAFRGITGLEEVYLADKARAGGELGSVLRAGYQSGIGLFGVHRYFHTRGDDMACVSGDLVQPVAAAYRAALAEYLT